MFAVRLGCRNYSRTFIVKTTYLQCGRQARAPPHRLLTVSAAGLKSNAEDITRETFQPTDILADTSRGAEAVGDIATSRGAEAAGDIVTQASNITHEMVDLSSVGLGGYWPSGLVQMALELLHNHAHLPWWGCIITLTVAMRLALFPLTVKLQKVARTVANLNKDAQVFHARINERKAAGDTVGMTEAAVELAQLYHKHNAHPLQMIPLNFAQVPIFLSMLYGLRGMTGLPLESFRTGGTLWFTDLVIPDPSFGLPLLACASFLGNIELGGESGGPENENLAKIRWVLRIAAVAILPVTVTFPCAVTMYWVTNSLFSTVQILFFKLHSVRKFFGIPEIIKK